MSNDDVKSVTRGGSLLAAAADSYAEIAERLGVSKTLVAYWITGKRRPKPDDMDRVEKEYGIPRSAWDEAAVTKRRSHVAKVTNKSAPPAVNAVNGPSSTGVNEPRKRRRGKTASADVGEGAPMRSPPALGDEDDDETARLRRFIRDGLRELEHDDELSPAKKADSLKKLVDARCALDKSTGEDALTMQRIAQHPEFKRVVKLITDAIAPHPEVLATVLAVLEESA